MKDVLKEINTCLDSGNRALVVTVTKKDAESISMFLNNKLIVSEYLHSEIDTSDRIEIIKKLRIGSLKGGIDVIAGVNLLREGLDLPEVSLILVFDANKRGFLRSRDSLVQIVGRASRNINGRVVFYASKDKNGEFITTQAMQECIDLTSQRRAIQEKYNKDNNITAQEIKKDIDSYFTLSGNSKKNKNDFINYKPEEKKKMLALLNDKLKIATANMEISKIVEIESEIDVINNM